MMATNPLQPQKVSAFFSMYYLVWAEIVLSLYLISTKNYQLFHCLVELFSIIVGCGLFTMAWHTRRYLQNQFLLFLGIAYLFISLLDLVHTLSFAGMPLFTSRVYYTTQLWIAARVLESLSLLVAFFFLQEGSRVSFRLIISVYSIICALVLLSILYWENFPVCFADGTGLTAFKKYSEYAICLMLAASAYFLNRYRDFFDEEVGRLLILSVIFTIISELAFTFYVSSYGFSNLVGHFFKLFSFWCLYRALIKTGLEDPYDLVFRDLNSKNWQLQAALAQVKTLSGLLPICASCKNIRDDKGYWRQLEGYLRDHSEVSFSHGICPACIEKLYPEFCEPFPHVGSNE